MTTIVILDVSNSEIGTNDEYPKELLEDLTGGHAKYFIEVVKTGVEV